MFQSPKKSLAFRLIASFVNVCFICSYMSPVRSYAQTPADLGMPAAGQMISLSSAYVPVIARGLRVHPENPILFDFLLDTGNSGLALTDPKLKAESEKLIKYFLASLTIPDEDQWVNLSPYEKNRIINDQLGQTEMGRDMLAEDYILKQLTSSLIYPEKELGKEFWNRVYTKAQQLYGTNEIPVNTFNKVWITADKADIYVHDNTAFVVASHLKVMLEEDYLSLQKHNGINNVGAGLASAQNGQPQGLPLQNDTHAIGSQIVREIVLPELEKEVNTGKNFYNLRQIFHSMVLAAWYKKNLKQAILNQVYSNKAKINGVNLADPTIKEQIYKEYLKAYKKGVFNYIKEDIVNGQTVPHKYFSGGLANMAMAERVVGREEALADLPKYPLAGRVVNVSAAMSNATGTPTAAMAAHVFQLSQRVSLQVYIGRLIEDLYEQQGSSSENYHFFEGYLRAIRDAKTFGELALAAHIEQGSHVAQEMNDVLHHTPPLESGLSGFREDTTEQLSAEQLSAWRNILKRAEQKFPSDAHDSEKGVGLLIMGANMSTKAKTMLSLISDLMTEPLETLKAVADAEKELVAKGGAPTAAMSALAEELSKKFFVNNEMGDELLLVPNRSHHGIVVSDFLNALESIEASLVTPQTHNKNSDQGNGPKGPFIVLGELKEKEANSVVIARNLLLKSLDGINGLKYTDLGIPGGLGYIGLQAEDPTVDDVETTSRKIRDVIAAAREFVADAQAKMKGEVATAAMTGLSVEQASGLVRQAEAAIRKENENPTPGEPQLPRLEDNLRRAQEVLAEAHQREQNAAMNKAIGDLRENIAGAPIDAYDGKNGGGNKTPMVLLYYSAHATDEMIQTVARMFRDPNIRFIATEGTIKDVGTVYGVAVSPILPASEIQRQINAWLDSNSAMNAAEISTIEGSINRFLNGRSVKVSLNQSDIGAATAAINRDASTGNVLFVNIGSNATLQALKDALKINANKPSSPELNPIRTLRDIRDEWNAFVDQLSSAAQKVADFQSEVAEGQRILAALKDKLVLDAESINEDSGEVNALISDARVVEEKMGAQESNEEAAALKVKFGLLVKLGEAINKYIVAAKAIPGKKDERFAEANRIAESISFETSAPTAAMTADEARTLGFSDSLIDNISNGNVITENRHFEILRMIARTGQKHLVSEWDAPGINDNGKRELLDLIAKANNFYPTRIDGYVENAKEQIGVTVRNEDPFGDFDHPTPPKNTVSLKDFNDPKFNEYVEEGIQTAGNSVFALVAGGLGERTELPNADYIPSALELDPLTGMTYLELYARKIKALQERSKDGKEIPFVIMTSKDTHDRTIKLLMENKFFGLNKLSVNPSKEDVENGRINQIIILEQESVPVIGSFTFENGKVTDVKLKLDPKDKYKLLMKPHNHVDIHGLIYNAGLDLRWKKEGRSQFVFFQVNNGQSFNGLPAVLGVASQTGAGATMGGIGSKPGENVGRLMTMSKPGREMTINREYNQIVNDTVGKDGDSIYPGNPNFFAIRMDIYTTMLQRNRGVFAEMINIKKEELEPLRARVASKESFTYEFRNPPRLEAMGQDAMKEQELNADNTFVVNLPTRGTFTAFKNSPGKATAAYRIGAYGEDYPGAILTYFEYIRYFLHNFGGMDINVEGNQTTGPTNGLPLKMGAFMSLPPEFALSPSEFSKRVKGGRVSDRSFFVFEGEGTLESINGLNLDGALRIRAPKGVNVRIEDVNVQNEGWKIATPKETDPLHIRYRDFDIQIDNDPNHVQIIDMPEEPGTYTVSISANEKTARISKVSAAMASESSAAMSKPAKPDLVAQAAAFKNRLRKGYSKTWSPNLSIEVLSTDKGNDRVTVHIQGKRPFAGGSERLDVDIKGSITIAMLQHFFARLDQASKDADRQAIIADDMPHEINVFTTAAMAEVTPLANAAQKTMLQGQGPEGGIDLNAANMAMNVNGEKITIKFDAAMMAQFQRGDFSGVKPFIINITPVASVLPILGFKEEDLQDAGRVVKA